MPLLLQHLLVLLLVGGCAVVLGRGLWRTLRARPGRVGNCCSKGCAPAAKAASASRVMFLPADRLRSNSAR